jgi:hypothetical protein
MNAWNRFWFSRADVLPQSASRVCFGLILIFFMIGTAPNWSRFYAADGIISLHDADLTGDRSDPNWCVMAWTDGILPIEVWWWVGFVLSILFTLGYKTRLATIGLFLFQSSLIHRNTYVVNGEELVVRMILFYGCFAPWGNRLSIDAWLARFKSSSSQKPLPMVWSWRLMQINFIAIYAISLPYKIGQDLDWIWGDAIHWTIASDMWWTRGTMSWITLEFNGLFRKIMTWGTLLVEGLFPLFVCFPRTKTISVLLLISLHVGIALTIPGVTLFTLSMVAGAVMFLPNSAFEAMALFCRNAASRLSLNSQSLFANQQPSIHS